MTLSRSSMRRPLAAAAAATVLAAGILAVVPAAHAADAGTGWVRFAQLSPDTAPVTVRLAPLSGSGDVALHVGYGDVTRYKELAAGTYTVSMIPADATEPLLSTTVTVDPSTTTTVVASGTSDDLGMTSVADDLTPPAPGTARIRLVQASTLAPDVDVTASNGVAVAQDVRTGEVTGYADIPAGPWTFLMAGAAPTGSSPVAGASAAVSSAGDATTASSPAPGGAAAGSVDVAVPDGGIVSLFVVDTADGGLTILPASDSLAAPTIQGGGVTTGGGVTAVPESSALASGGAAPTTADGTVATGAAAAPGPRTGLGVHAPLEVDW
jgi:hypothetical protein